MRRKGTPCACESDPCGCGSSNGKCIKAINNVSPDPNGDFEIAAGNGIAISQSGDNEITITNDAIASSFVAGDNIEINPAGDNLEIRVTDNVFVNGSGTIGSDTKPIKIVNGVATAITYELERKIENQNIAAINYSTAQIGTTGTWVNQSGTVNIPTGSPYYSSDSGGIKVLESGVYLITARLANNVSQYEALSLGTNYSQNTVHNTQISETVYIPANTVVKAALYGSANTGTFQQYNGLNKLTIVKL